MIKDATSEHNYPSIADFADIEQDLYESLHTDISDSEKEYIEEFLEIIHNLRMIYIKFEEHRERSERLKVHEH